MRIFTKWMAVAAIAASSVLTVLATSQRGHADEPIAPITYEQPITSPHARPPEGPRASAPPVVPGAKPSAAMPLRRSGDDDATDSTSTRSSLVSMFGSLTIVLALFLILMWMMRRWTPGTALALPAEIVQSLGRTAIAPRCHVHLVRCGNKLLLVSLSQAGVQTLTEITENQEVDRITAACQHRPGRASFSSRWWAAARPDNEIVNVDPLSRSAKRSHTSSTLEDRHG